MKIRYASSHDFLKSVLDSKSTANPSFSLRAAAKYSGISATHLSQMLSQKKKMTMDVAYKIIEWLKLDSSSAEYFLLVVQLETMGPGKRQDELTSKKQNLDRQQYVIEIQDLLERSEPRKVYTYRKENSADLNSLVLLQDKKSKQPIPEFYDPFISPGRSVAGIGYFFPNEDSTFRCYFQEITNLGLGVDSLITENDKIKIHFDQNGLPTMDQMTLRTVGSSIKSTVSVVYSEQKRTYHGYELDENDPKYKKEISIFYVRT